VIGRLFPKHDHPQPIAAPRIPDGLRVFAIGDIHGCSSLLDELHGRIAEDIAMAPPERVLIVYLGDYVDRGPDSSGVIARLSQDPPANAERVFLKGNHEAMMLAFLEGRLTASDWRLHGGTETLRSYGVNVHEVLKSKGAEGLPEELNKKFPAVHRRWLDQLALSFQVGDYFFCHAGARSGVALADQSEHDLLWMREKCIGHAGDFEHVIVHGHTPVSRPEVMINPINIDTGAYFTGILTAVALEGTERRLIQTAR
jgi:serine/threonine protein phosphatase 1